MRRRRHVAEKHAFQQELEDLFAKRVGYHGDYTEPEEPRFFWEEPEEEDESPGDFYDNYNSDYYLDDYEDYYDDHAAEIGLYHAKQLDDAVAEIQRLRAVIREQAEVIDRIRAALNGHATLSPKPEAPPAKTR